MKKLIIFTIALLLAAIPTFAAPKKKTSTATRVPAAQMEQAFLGYYTQSIASIKKQLPQKMDPVGEMTAIDFSSKTRCTTLGIKVANQNVAQALKVDTANVQLFCESVVSSFIGNPKTEAQVGEMMVACKFSYKFIFKDSLKNVIATRTVSAKQFASLYKKAKLIATADPKKMNLSFFKELVEMSNNSATTGEKVHMEGHVIYDDMYCDSASTALYKLFIPGGEDTLKAYFQNVAAGIEADSKNNLGIDRIIAMERLNITEEMRLYDVDNNLMASYKFTPADLREPVKDADWNYFIYIINHQFTTDDYKTCYKDNKIVIQSACDVEQALYMKYAKDTDEAMMRDNVAKTLAMEWAMYLPLLEQHGTTAEMNFFDASDKTVVKTLTFTVEDLKNALKKLQQ